MLSTCKLRSRQTRCHLLTLIGKLPRSEGWLVASIPAPKSFDPLSASGSKCDKLRYAIATYAIQKKVYSEKKARVYHSAIQQ